MAPAAHGDRVRPRGAQVTRLEAFTDAAFAFAVTLLMISAGDVPRNVADLERALLGVPAFVASFAIVAFFWLAHYRWSRRYGLETPGALALSLAVVAIVLVWVYPLRTIAGAFFHWITGGRTSAEFAIASPADLATVFIVYGLGFAALSAAIALLYRHALGCGDALALAAEERIATRGHVAEWLAVAAIAALSVALALALAREPFGWWSAAPGVAYFLIGPAIWACDAFTSRRLAALATSEGSSPAAAAAGDDAPPHSNS